VRPVAGHHRHEHAAGLAPVIQPGQQVVDAQVGDPLAVGEAVGVVARGVDVGLQMHVRLGGRQHHARRLHLDRLEIDGGDLHAVQELRLADRIFQRRRRANAAEQKRGRQGQDRQTEHAHGFLPLGARPAGHAIIMTYALNLSWAAQPPSLR